MVIIRVIIRAITVAITSVVCMYVRMYYISWRNGLRSKQPTWVHLRPI
jgi:hypothetical protein